VANLFTAVGGEWTFFGEDRSILLEKDVRAFFEIGHPTADEGDSLEESLTVDSHFLQISHSLDGFVLNFLQSVTVHTAELSLGCNSLTVEISFTEPFLLFGQTMDREAIRSIRAEGDVHLDQVDRSMEADVAEIFPEEGVIVLSGDVSIEDQKGVWQGDYIVFRRTCTAQLGEESDRALAPSGEDFGADLP
jgi:hypothetical protein